MRHQILLPRSLLGIVDVPRYVEIVGSGRAIAWEQDTILGPEADLDLIAPRK